MEETAERIAVMTCPICGRTHTCEAWSENAKEFLEAHPQVCQSPDCQAKQSEKRQEEARIAAAEEAKKRAEEGLARRLEESGIDRYELGFDPNRREANTALATWWIRNLDRSAWVFGPTGSGKTRTMQNAARMAVRDRSIRYWPAFDLAARLTETSKHPEAQLMDIYRADLLILDDLGVANITASRLAALVAIVDRRYAGWDQVRRAQGSEQPTFGWTSYGRRRVFGGQVWITSQASPDELIARLAAVDANDASALVRRLADMCVVHEAEAVR